MRAIFISYRRDDSEGHAGRLFEDLSQAFGADAVFMDVAGIAAGRDFRKVIEEHTAACQVLLALIGKNWATAVDADGHRRLDDPLDFVRLETASALKRDIPVIPVLVQGGRMPKADQLPDDLKELVYRNNVELTHARWDSDVQVLIQALRPLIAAPTQPAAVAAPGAPEPGPDPAPMPTAARPAKSRRVAWLAGLFVALAAAGGGAYVVVEQNRQRAAAAAQARQAEAEAARRAEAEAQAERRLKAEQKLRADEASAVKAAEQARAEAEAARQAQARQEAESTARARAAAAAAAEAQRKAAVQKAANEARAEEQARLVREAAADQARRDAEARAAEQAKRDAEVRAAEQARAAEAARQMAAQLAAAQARQAELERRAEIERRAREAGSSSIPRPDPRPPPGTCVTGYVWRAARASDRVCVSPAVRSETAAENAQAAARRQPGGGPHGPETCRQGFVWREAFAGDTVCVPPPSRSRAAADNANAAARVVR